MGIRVEIVINRRSFLKKKRKEESCTRLELTNVVNVNMTISEDDYCSMVVGDKVADARILDSGGYFKRELVIWPNIVHILKEYL